MTSDCICNQIFRCEYSTCEPSTRYLCEQKGVTVAPEFRLNNETITREQAVNIAADVLSSAARPLITELNVLGSRSIRKGIALARRCRAVIDGGGESGAQISSLVREGSVTATMGEITHRSDRLLLVDCDPATTHPRFFKQILASKSETQLATIARRGLDMQSQSKTFQPALQYRTDCLESDLIILQSLLQQSRWRNSIAPGKIAIMRNLAHWLYSGKYVAILAGGLTDSCQDTLSAICKFLNRKVKTVLLPMRSDANAIGVEFGLAAATGFPRAVDFSRGYPCSFGAGEFSASTILRRKEFDALMTFDINSPPARADKLARTVVLNLQAEAENKTVQHGDRDLTWRSFLKIQNLHSWNDDFHRFDHLSFQLKSPSLPDNHSVCSILDEILTRIK